MHGGRNIAYLIQKNGSALGQGKPAGFVPSRIRKGPGFVAKQLRLEQGIGQRPAIEGDEFLGPAFGHFVNGARKQLFSGAAGPFDQHGAITAGDRGKNLKNAPHGRAAANNIRKPVLLLGLPMQFLDHAQIPKALDSTHHLPFGILENGGGYADGNALALGIDHIDHLVHHRPAGGQRLFEGTCAFANAGAEYITATPPDRVLARDAGDLLGGAIEERDAPVGVHGKHPVGYVVE